MNLFSDYIDNHRKIIYKRVEQIVNSNDKHFEKISCWGTDSKDKLLKFIKAGKIIRGSLILFSYEAFSETTYSDDTLTAAAAMELFHSGLLIHDDIMDKDETRRGYPSIPAQYQKSGIELKVPDSYHMGLSLAMCLGDLSYFLGFEALSKIENKSISTLISRELLSVGISQMQDVYQGLSPYEPDEEQVLITYRYKTARYTFSLPLIIGAVLAGQTSKTIEIVTKLGEALGLVFQLKDDELGIFQSSKETGKPEGSDIRENKKTLLRLYLRESSSHTESDLIKNYFGKKLLSNEDMAYIRKTISKSKAMEKIENLISEKQLEALELITRLSIKNGYIQVVNDLLKYNKDRIK